MADNENELTVGCKLVDGEMVCTGTAGAPANFVPVPTSVETANIPAAVIPATSRSQRLAARRPASTIVSSGVLARGPTAFMFGVVSFTVGVVSRREVL